MIELAWWKFIDIEYDYDQQITAILKKVGWKYYKVHHSSVEPMSFGEAENFKEYINRDSKLSFWIKKGDRQKRIVEITTKGAFNRDLSITQMNEKEFNLNLKRKISISPNVRYHAIQPNSEIKISPNNSSEMDSLVNSILNELEWKYIIAGKFNAFGEKTKIMEYLDKKELYSYGYLTISINESGRANRIILHSGNKATYQLTLKFMSSNLYKTKQATANKVLLPSGQIIYSFNES